MDSRFKYQYLFFFPQQLNLTYSVSSYIPDELQESNSQFFHSREAHTLGLDVAYYIQFRPDLFTYPTNVIVQFYSLDFSHNSLLTPRLCILHEWLKRCRIMLSVKCLAGWRNIWFSNISMLHIQLIIPTVIGFPTGMCHWKKKCKYSPKPSYHL